MRLAHILATAATIALLPTAAWPQAAEPSCPAVPAPLPGSLAGWADASPLQGSLIVGKAADIVLLPIAKISFGALPEKPGKAGTHGTVLRFTVAQAGSYRVALSAVAWIDVLRGAKPSPSIAHAHGPACSGIRKMVDFRLEPGAHVLQLSGSERPAMRVLVTRLP